MNGGGVGAHGQLTPGPNVPSLGTKHKRSKNVFPVIFTAINLRHIWARLLELPVQSLIGSPGTLCRTSRLGQINWRIVLTK